MKNKTVLQVFIITFISIISIILGMAVGFLTWILTQHNFFLTEVMTAGFTIISLVLNIKIFERWI